MAWLMFFGGDGVVCKDIGHMGVGVQNTKPRIGSKGVVRGSAFHACASMRYLTFTKVQMDKYSQSSNLIPLSVDGH